MRFCSFFSGIGGFELGLTRAGHEHLWGCEIDKFARRVYRARFKGVELRRDVTRVKAKEVPEADLWCGGFPCQDVSVAGLRGGLKRGTRSSLVFQFLRLAQERQPEWLLLENVPGLLSGKTARRDMERGEDSLGEDGGDTSWFGALLGALVETGYTHAAWRVLDAQWFGVAQQRRRVFILARRAGGGAGPSEVLLEPEGVPRRVAPRRVAGEGVAHALTTRPGERRSAEDDYLVFNPTQITHPANRSRLEPRPTSPPLLSTGAGSHIAFVLNGEKSRCYAKVAEVGRTLTTAPSFTRHRGGTLVAFSHKDSGASVGGDVSVTLKAQECAAVLRDFGVRRFTPLECERLQGFPDGWTALPGASDSRRYKAIGNAVAVPVAEWIGRRLTRAES